MEQISLSPKFIVEVRNTGVCCEKWQHDVKLKCDVSSPYFDLRGVNSASSHAVLVLAHFFTSLHLFWSLKSELD